MPKNIKFEAEIEFEKTPAQVKIKAIENPWSDLGYLLEIMSFMCRVVMDHEEMTKEEVIAYTANYLERAIPDYRASKRLL